MGKVSRRDATREAAAEWYAEAKRAGLFDNDDPVLFEPLPEPTEAASALDLLTSIFDSCGHGASGHATLYGEHVARELKRTGRTLADLQPRHYFDATVDDAHEAAIDFGLRCVFQTNKGGRSASPWANRCSTTLIGAAPLRGVTERS